MNEQKEFDTKESAEAYAQSSGKRCPLRLGALCLGDTCAWFESAAVVPVWEKIPQTDQAASVNELSPSLVRQTARFKARHGHCEPTIYMKSAGE